MGNVKGDQSSTLLAITKLGIKVIQTLCVPAFFLRRHMKWNAMHANVFPSSISETLNSRLPRDAISQSRCTILLSQQAAVLSQTTRGCCPQRACAMPIMLLAVCANINSELQLAQARPTMFYIH